MADPFSASAAFAFINSAFKLAEYTVKFSSVESENEVFVRMIQRVRLDLEETERLLCVPSVRKKLISTPGKLPWIKGVINSAKNALNEIGRWVERARADKEGFGSVSWENRVFNDHDKLVTRRMELGTSHQALSTVLFYLAPLEQTESAVDEAPPKYDDATFFDDFLSPRQKRRKAWETEKSFGAEKEDEGTFNKGIIQPMQALGSVSFTSQLTAQNEVGIGGNTRTSGDANSSQTLNVPSASPWSAATGKMSLSSLPPSTIESNPFPNSTPITLFSEPATQRWSSKSDEAPPTPRSSSGSVSSVSRRPMQHSIPVSSMWPPTTVPSSVTSPTPSWALANPPGYGEQAEMPVSTASTSSWPSTVPSQSTSAAQQTEGITSLRPSGPSNNWAFPQALPSANPLPACQPPTSQAPKSFGSANACMSDIYPRDTPSHQRTSSTLPPASRPTPLQQFSATNFQGPIDPFELSVELDVQAISICSQEVHPVEVDSVFAIQQHMSLQNSPVLQKACQSPAQTDTVAEMMGDLSILHQESHSSMAEIPSTDSFNELPGEVPSWQNMPTSQSKMLRDAINRYGTSLTSATELPTEPYYAIERWQNPPPQFGGDAPTSTYAEMPSHAISQVPQAYQQYPPSIQPQIQPQLKPQYQSQYQPYVPQIPTPDSYASFLIPISPAAPSPIPWQEQQYQQIDQTSVAPLTQEATVATTVQPTALTLEQEYSFSRPATLGEVRRRNQKALLDLIGRVSYE